MMKYFEDQIDAYIRGEMALSEKAAFEAELKQNPDLAREVSLMRLVVDGLRDRQEKKERISSWQEDTGHRMASRADARRKWLPWVTAFSTAAAVVAGVFLFHPSTTPVMLPEPSSYQPVMRSLDYSEIDSLIEQGNYEDAIRAIEAEIAENDSLLQEYLQIREEADYNVELREYALEQLRMKREALRAKEKAE